MFFKIANKLNSTTIRCLKDGIIILTRANNGRKYEAIC